MISNVSSSKILTTNGVKRRRLFGADDDKRLKEIVQSGDFKGWKEIAKIMPNFTAKQLRDRWHNYISPTNSFAPWTIEEDMVIVAKVAEVGTKWSYISNCLRGRSDNSIKNRWNTVLKYSVIQNPDGSFMLNTKALETQLALKKLDEKPQIQTKPKRFPLLSFRNEKIGQAYPKREEVLTLDPEFLDYFFVHDNKIQPSPPTLPDIQRREVTY